MWYIPPVKRSTWCWTRRKVNYKKTVISYKCRVRGIGDVEHQSDLCELCAKDVHQVAYRHGQETTQLVFWKNGFCVKTYKNDILNPEKISKKADFKKRVFWYEWLFRKKEAQESSSRIRCPVGYRNYKKCYSLIIYEFNHS